MQIKTHLKLYLRELIDNWKYIDTIIFLIILLIYVGYADPCDRCIVKFNGGEQTCKEAFLSILGYTDVGGIAIKNSDLDYNLNYSNVILNP